MSSRLFGTDGIRGKAGEGILQAQSVLALARAAGVYCRQEGLKPLACLAHDGRRSAGMIAGAFEAGLLAEGIDVHSLGLLTTPALAFLSRQRKAGLGVMISASHNPATDNGIKLFGPGGSKLSDRAEERIESLFGEISSSPPKTAAKIGIRTEDAIATSDYSEHLRSIAFPSLRLRGWKIVLDAAHGGGSFLGPTILRAFGATVISTFCDPNGDNINQGCGAVHPEVLARRVRREKARIGIALDGDGDRSIFVDEKGEVLDGDATLFILAKDLLSRRRLAKKTVVATVMSNLGLRIALAELGVRLHTVAVGDRQVVEALREQKLSLGGEQSGHIVFGKDHHFVGDGIYTALRLLEAMHRAGKPLSEIRRPFRRLPQVLRNVRVSVKPPFEERPRIVQSLRGVERQLGENGRVLLRYSGTEPLARVMVEGPDLPQITGWAEEIAAAIAAELS